MSKKRCCIYIFEEDWKSFLKICNREGVNASIKLNEFIKFYIQQHSNGNPQLLMTHYVKPEESVPMRVLCLYCQGAISGGEVYCQRLGMWVKGIRCYSCKHNRLKKK